MKSGTISAAVRQLGRTRPALSAAVKELGKSIIVNCLNAKKVDLCQCQKRFFYLKSHWNFGTGWRTASAIADRCRSKPDKITVSSMPVLSEHFLPGVIANFCKNHPKAGFQVAVQKSPEVISSKEAQWFDIGLAERGEDTELIKCQRFDVDCVCALPSGSHLLKNLLLNLMILQGDHVQVFFPNITLPRRWK